MSESKKTDFSEKRSAPRTAFNARVKITQDGFEEFFVYTRDLSDAGVFVCVNADQKFPLLGSTVKVQMQGLPVPAPVLDMVVVRKGMDGYGLHFISEPVEGGGSNRESVK